MMPSQVNIENTEGKIRLEVDGVSTGWMSPDDSFLKRIDSANISRDRPVMHLIKEIEMKNLLDEGRSFLQCRKFKKAIECLDGVLFYDPDYDEALIVKSHALYGQKHFVKALRYYGLSAISDGEYHRLLLAKSSEERDDFPKFKRQIYMADEFFAIGDYEKALESYKNALANPSIQKEKILFNLLNKIATTYLELNDFEDALVYFNESLNQLNNDYAWFGKGCCEYELGIDGAGDSLAKAVNITKGQLLEKGRILNELGFYDEALKTFDYLLENHFREDEMLEEAIRGRESAKKNL